MYFVICFIYIDRIVRFCAAKYSSAILIYEWPTDTVRTKLDHWQDLKFGMIIHWGLYSRRASWNHGTFVRKIG